MSSNFPFAPFAEAVHNNIVKFNKAGLEFFTVNIDGDALWSLYLAAFPEGTNPMYRVRTEHDCSLCRNFVKNFGNVVVIVDGNKRSIWSAYTDIAFPFGEVAKALNDAVVAAPINGLFRTDQTSYGQKESKQLIDGTRVHVWNHFYSEVPSRFVVKTHKVGTDVVSVGSVKGDYAQHVTTLENGMLLPAEDIKAILDLASSKPVAIYRGEEEVPVLTAITKAQAAYNKAKSKNVFVWEQAAKLPKGFYTSLLGKTIRAIPEDGIEKAVNFFETQKAGPNYKRSSALITPKMIEAAQETLSALGLEGAVHRRFANIGDVSVNNVLWVDRAAKAQMKGGIVDLLADQAVTKVTKPADAAVVTKIAIDKFMSDVLPKATSLDVYLQAQHQGNFVSVTTSDDAAKLFKWDNPFAWSYDGNVTDGIKERVAKAGGNVTNAKLRVSLSWFNRDDLDLHVVEPDGNRIYHANKRSIYGSLDVDMNVSSPRRDAVENVSFTRTLDGIYGVYVNNYTKRESIDVGCVIEVESAGKISQLSYAQTVKTSASIWDTWKGAVHIADLTVRDGKVTNIETGKGVVGGGISQEKWGVKTEDYTKVKTVMFSPNYWDDNATGNKHWFFLLEGCKADLPTRGIYNEFLRSDLDKHRKVFEVLGDKTKCPVVDDQLSGVGFSSTRSDELTVRVKSGKIEKLYSIQFNA